jgi:hypothetical protein
LPVILPGKVPVARLGMLVEHHRPHSAELVTNIARAKLGGLDRSDRRPTLREHLGPAVESLHLAQHHHANARGALPSRR